MPESRTTAPALDRFFEYSLLGMMASGYLAVASSGELDLPTLLGAGAALVVRALIVAGLFRLPVTELFLNIAAIAYTGFYPVDCYYLSGRMLPATVHLVFFLAAILLIKARAPRDYALLRTIAILEVLAASILTETVGYLLFLGAFLLCGIANLSSAEIRRNLEAPQRVARLAARRLPWSLGGLSVIVFAGVLAIASGMFVILPRTARAALQHIAPDRFHLPGFANEVRLGQIGEILQSSEPVMHVRLADSRISPALVSGLKFRGSALAEFDGRRWFNPPGGSVETLPVEHGVARLLKWQEEGRVGERAAFEIQLTNSAGDVLFLPGIPDSLVIDAPQILRTGVDSYRVGAGWPPGLRYASWSFIETAPPPAPLGNLRLTPEERARYLGTPRLDPRIRELAASLVEHSVTQADKAAALERYLRTSFTYTMELPRYSPRDPIADFLFSRRKGHCEYFASAMALMLRQVGIPSRVATGFLNGRYNPLSGWYVIRASEAHSWVEAYLDGYGWRSYDPTPPAVAAQRETLLTRLNLYVDAAEIFWQDWVVAYDLDHQLALATRMSRSRRVFSIDWSGSWDRVSQFSKRLTLRIQPASGIGLALAVLLLLATRFGKRVLSWWRTRRRVSRLGEGNAQASDATLLYSRMLELMRKRGIERPVWMTPLEFSRALPPTIDPAAVAEFTASYNALRFGGRQQAAARMIALLETLESANPK